VWTLPISTKHSGEKLRRKILDLESDLDAANRKIRVIEAERDAMAEVIARDRLRVQSETAAYARAKAESESDGRNRQST